MGVDEPSEQEWEVVGSLFSAADHTDASVSCFD
jgi:hypothetical protein